MFVKIGMAAAFFLMVGAPLAGASESARTIAISGLHTPMSLHESASIVVAQDAQSSDSADSDSDSSDSNDDNENDNGDSSQSAGNDQSDQQAAAPQGFQAPDSDASDAGQVPLNAYPQQVNPNQ